MTRDIMNDISKPREPIKLVVIEKERTSDKIFPCSSFKSDFGFKIASSNLIFVKKANIRKASIKQNEAIK